MNSSFVKGNIKNVSIPRDIINMQVTKNKGPCTLYDLQVNRTFKSDKIYRMSLASKDTGQGILLPSGFQPTGNTKFKTHAVKMRIR